MGPSHTGVLLSSTANGGLLPIETVRAPRSHAMIELIQQFSELANTIERLSSKSLVVQVDFPTSDFPKETAERLEIVAKADRYVHALAVKDQMLWVTLKEKEKAEQALAEEQQLNARYRADMAAWANMGQTLKETVDQLKLERTALHNRMEDMLNVMRANNIHYEF